VNNDGNGGGMASRADSHPTIERIERAIDLVAEMTVKHDMQLGPTIRFLEAELDKLRQATADMDYAKELLAKRAQQRKQHRQPEIDLNH
jgi:hypothetical protein